MIVDIVIGLLLFISGVIGLKSGFIKTIFKFVGYIAGGFFGIYIALKVSSDWALDIKRIGFVIFAIIASGSLGSFLGGLIAKALKSTIFRGPLAHVDSLAGAALEMARVIVVAYLIATVLLWSPWESVQNQIAKSQILLKVQPYFPQLITQANDWVKEEFLNLRP
jgi:uncharacterized membrane protein required for colicin V production